jgi:hypothetical protein
MRLAIEFGHLPYREGVYPAWFWLFPGALRMIQVELGILFFLVTLLSSVITGGPPPLKSEGLAIRSEASRITPSPCRI